MSVGTDPFEDKGAYRGQVRMATLQVAGLSRPELEMALAFEVEPSSLIPAAEAEVTFRQIPDPDPTVSVFEVAVRRRKAVKQKGLSRWIRPAMILGGVVLFLTGADFAYLQHRTASVGAAVRQRTPLQQQIDSTMAKVRSVRNECEQVRSEREAKAKAQEDAARLRSANVVALKVMASSLGGQVVLKNLSGEPFRMSAKAMATSAENAAETMAILSAKCAEKGWKVEVGNTTSVKGGKTVEFSYMLKYE